MAYTEDDEKFFEDGTEVQFKEEETPMEESDNGSVSQDLNSNFIIALDAEHRSQPLKIYTIGGTYMKLRRPLVLRFHKYKQLSEPHEFYFSQLRLYHPHSVEDMTEWESSLEKCRAPMKNLSPL